MSAETGRAVADNASAAPLMRLWLPVFALFTLHNLEEIGLDLPAWGRARGVVMPTTGMGQAGFALVVAGLSAVLFALAFALRRNAAGTRRTLMLFLVVMALNFVWHVAASLFTQSLQPGVLSAVVLLPVFVWLFWRARRRSKMQRE